MLAPGDIFLATPGHRESTRWVVGGIPAGGLNPGEQYWVLAQAGIIGNFIGDSPVAKGHLGRVNYLGAVRLGDRSLNIREFAVPTESRRSDNSALVYLVLGTSAEVGKTTAGIGIIRSLIQRGHETIVTLKATGTSSISELFAYRDFGATHVFDCVDFGLPTTYPSGRAGMEDIFDRALDLCLCMPADAIIIECGGDFLGANVPTFLQSLKRRRADSKVILAAADALGALGGKLMLRDMGFSVDLITGLCTDTPTLRQRTESLCGIPALNMSRQKSESLPI
ncbi:hypothetical protein [Bradyrhizobium centrosematis]|uniref:hypothetical protein n=1 Tax=Bradyrhizobium centrosematis TaxID=1300039 RepID=UPI0021682C91|nr:hypothetical protein [Bradyrhizobium centrosematis]MCS3763127.1 hypothetical protein [Bradyrhizobium centrosematis]MCS3775794.1 hypothetical protein [Bradyrhizobium centrosematis]